MGQQSGQKSIIPAKFLSYYWFLASVSPILQIEFIKLLNYMKKTEEGDVCGLHYIIRPTRKAEPSLSKAHDSFAVFPSCRINHWEGGAGGHREERLFSWNQDFQTPLAVRRDRAHSGWYGRRPVFKAVHCTLLVPRHC